MQNKDLAAEISRFSSEHPEGWGHDEWQGFLHQLSESGYDTSDADGIGLALESQRLTRVLQGMDIKGLGPKRIVCITDHFGTLWNLMSASADDLAQLPSVSRPLAEQILEVLQ